jgi:hypothetical protein
VVDPKPIPKSLALRFQDLLVALKVTRDLVGAVRIGQTYHMAPLYGQLRAMLTDKASGNTPLLPAVADEVGYPMTLFSMPGIDDEPWPDGAPEPEIHINPGAPSLHRVAPGQVEMELADYMDRKMVRWQEHTFSAASVIKDFANTSGGAHYSKDLKQQIGWFLSIQLNETPAVVNGLLQIAELTLEMGTDLIRKVSGAMLVVDSELVEMSGGGGAVLFDSVYPDSPMRMTLALQDDGRIYVSLRGLDGATLVGVSNSAVTVPSRCQFGARFQVETDLSTRLELLLNGAVDRVAKSNEPILLVLNDDSNNYWNRTLEDDKTGMHLCLIETMMLGAEASALEQAQVLGHMMSVDSRTTKSSCVDLPFGSWALAPEGTRDLELHGHATYQSHPRSGTP